MGCELAPKEAPEGMKLGTFAGGCFWGLELAMQRVPGVLKTSAGYTGGETPNPTYETVCSGRTGHAEAVQVRSVVTASCMRHVYNIAKQAFWVSPLHWRTPTPTSDPLAWLQR